MKIAFLGKGGSGKSTLATAAVRHFHATGRHVLAIDADHNMDLSLNLGVDSPSVALGSDPYLIKRYVGLTDEAGYGEVRREAERRGLSFSINPRDEFTALVTTEVAPRLLLMTAGPHTDIVRSGEHCSHSLAAPLKVYLPLLHITYDEAVVIDERAGTDPVATGILGGVDCAVIVVEPTIHSVRVAKQIAHELSLANVRHMFAGNKGSAGTEFTQLPFAPAIVFTRTANGELSASETTRMVEAIEAM